mgnify:CR=1 FL=1
MHIRQTISCMKLFCLDGEKDEFKPYEKHHGTVKDSAELAQELQVKNLLLWHTEDKNIRKRKSLYKKEAKKYYKGNVYVPYDREIIELKIVKKIRHFRVDNICKVLYLFSLFKSCKSLVL